MWVRSSKIALIAMMAAVVAGAAGCAKPKVNVQVSRDKIQQGDDVKVSWTSKDAKTVSLNGEKVDKTGSKVYNPNSTTTYTAVAKKGSKEARDSKTVDVSGRAARPTISISADPEGIVRGTSTTLRWNSTNADKVTISDLGTVQGSGSRAVSPSQSTTYTAQAQGPGGTADAEARVTVSDIPTRGGVESRPPVINATIAALFARNVKIIYFDYDKAELRPEAKDRLRLAAQWLTQSPNRTIVFRIEGNCDPRGTEEYNIGLGERRAQVSREFLASLGVDPSRMQTVSYGRERAQGGSEGSPDSPPSWSHDRHDDFVYLSGGTAPNPEPVQMFFEFE
jgi:peptidoglycan-associated lipoprotein